MGHLGQPALPRFTVANDGCWAAVSCLLCQLPACVDDAAEHWGGLARKQDILQQHWEALGGTGDAPMDSRGRRGRIPGRRR